MITDLDRIKDAWNEVKFDGRTRVDDLRGKDLLLEMLQLHHGNDPPEIVAARTVVSGKQKKTTTS